MKILARKLVICIAFCLSVKNTGSAIVLSQTVRDYLKKAILAEDGALDWRHTGYFEFEALLKQHWQEVLNDFDSLDLTEHDKLIIVAGCERLDDAQYPAFLQKLGVMFASKKIDERVIDVVFAPSGRREGFLNSHTNDPNVRSFLNSVHTSLPKTDRLAGVVNEFLAEGSKQRDEPPFNTQVIPNQPAATSPVALPTVRPNILSESPSAATAGTPAPQKVNVPALWYVAAGAVAILIVIIGLVLKIK